VVIALGLSALVGSAIGWFLLTRTSPPERSPRTTPDRAAQQPAVSLPPEELDQRQQLFSRLRVLQVDRGWFINLVDASQLSSESLGDGPLRRVWPELAEEWLPRIEQLPPAIRAQLGRLRAGDWQQPREALLKQGVHPRVVEHLVSAGAQDLLPVTMRDRKPADPFLQLWIAAAIQSLDDVEIVRLKARPLEPTNTSLPIPAGGARLVLVEAPAGDAVVLGINGTPLMQMMVFGVNGQVEEERGPLRVTRIVPEAGSPLQVLVTNEGVSSGVFTLSCRVAPLDQ
jgi:serine/threonine-protein kinase